MYKHPGKHYNNRRRQKLARAIRGHAPHLRTLAGVTFPPFNTSRNVTTNVSPRNLNITPKARGRGPKILNLKSSFCKLKLNVEFQNHRTIPSRRKVTRSKRER